MTTLELEEDALPEFLRLRVKVDGQEAGILHLTKEDFNGPLSVRQHSLIVTAIRIGAGLTTSGEGNWEAAASFLEGVGDASAFANAMGYNLGDWL